MATRNAEVVAHGGQMLTVLMDGATPGVKPTMANLNSWINGRKVTFTGVLDNVGTPDSFVDNYGADRDWFFTFELGTMKLVDVRQGDPTGALDNLFSLIGYVPDAGVQGD